MNPFSKYLLPVILISVSISLSAQQKIEIPKPHNKNVDNSLYNEINHSLKQGLTWLLKQQKENGSWENNPAFTALVISAVLRFDYSLIEDSTIDKAFKYLEKCVKEDGSIWASEYPNYTTSICLLAFKDANNVKYTKIIHDAEIYLVSNQFDESDGLTKDSLLYGGISYDSKGDTRKFRSADLSNMQWTLEALQSDYHKDIELLSPEEKSLILKKQLFVERALVFLSKCQNYQGTNPEKYSGSDGGFIYAPGISKAGGSRSYGSMAYAGLKSMIYANVSKNDPRVISAFNWIKENYNVDSNSNMGKQGLFYSYQTMAKALSAYGIDEIMTGTNGHNWRTELAGKLLEIQNEEGWWQNSNGRWMENNKILVTAYCILALEEIIK